MNFEKPHLSLNGKTAQVYKALSPGITPRIPIRDREKHADNLRKQLQALPNLESGQTNIIAIKGKEGYDLQYQQAASKSHKSEILSLEKNLDKDQQIAILRVTPEAIRGLEKKIDQYQNELTKPNKQGVTKPKHEPFINSVEIIEAAFINSIFVGKKSDLPQDLDEERWWEIYVKGGDIDRDTLVLSRTDLRQACEALDINLNLREAITFVDTQALLIKTSLSKLNSLALTCSALLSFRVPSTATIQHCAQARFELAGIDNILPLIEEAPEGSPRVTVVDTGVNHGHPLLAPVIPEHGVHTVDTSSASTADYHGHGTQVVGIAAYGDIAAIISNNQPVALEHAVESVRIKIDRNADDVSLWGLVTERAITKAEENFIELPRIYNFSMSQEGAEFDGKATSWSESIDRLSYNNGYGRLITVSAGNIHESNIDANLYPGINLLHTIENPSHALNAICVGAYTEMRDFVPRSTHDNYMYPPNNGHRYIAGSGQLSPHSRTGKFKSVIKPEIVCEGGNIIADRNGTSASCESSGLCYLTTSNEYSDGSPYTLLWATSLATPLAARMLAIIYARNSGRMPATIRGLLIHSASWTHEMLRQFPDKHSRIRAFGYGMPNLEAACRSASSALTLIAEDVFYLNNEESKRQMLYYKLPIPKEELLALGNHPVELKVTLSFFIEPNSRFSARNYEGASLAWDMQGPAESDEDFLKRINKNNRTDDDRNFRSSIPWEIGSTLRKKGSVQSDRWTCEAAVLASCEHIAIYPRNGWWADKPKEKTNPSIAYSLIISINAGEIDTDLYTAVQNIIELPPITPSAQIEASPQ